MGHEQPRRPSSWEIRLAGGLGDETTLGLPLGLEQVKDIPHATSSLSAPIAEGKLGVSEERRPIN
jgi:hypothetical protein